MDENIIFLICGETGSGKSSLADYMCDYYGMRQVISYTTRPQRNEDDTGHIFITLEEMEGFTDIVASTKIGDYYYFATKQQLLESNIYVIDYDGIKSLKQQNLEGIRFVTVYINLDRKTREERAVKNRGDDPMVFHDRSIAEYSQFMEMRRNGDFDYSICNKDFKKAAAVLTRIIATEIVGE